MFFIGAEDGAVPESMPMFFLGTEEGAVQESMPMVFLGAEDDAVQEFCGGESDSLDELGVEYLVPSLPAAPESFASLKSSYGSGPGVGPCRRAEASAITSGCGSAAAHIMCHISCRMHCWLLSTRACMATRCCS